MTTPRPLASHVWLLFIHDDGTVVAIEAIPPEVRRFDLAEKRGHLLRGYRIFCTDAQARLMEKAARTAVGRPYALDAVLAALVSVASGHPERWWLNAGQRFDCVMLAAEVVRGAGVPFAGDTPAFDLTPAGAEAALVAAGYPRLLDPLAA